MRVNFEDRTQGVLEGLRSEGTFKTLKHLTTPVGNVSHVQEFGDEIMLCSNNYIGLANKREVVEAGLAALEKYGAGASSVRFICGTFDIHKQLEERLAKFLGFAASITYSSCFAANTAAIPAFLQPGDAVISDELNHASIIDGCRMVHKSVSKHVYKHADIGSLEEKLKLTKDCPVVLVVTDGVFSMEGDIAPLPNIIALCKKYGATLMVDESHATGVIGNTGRGTMEYYNITEGVDILSGTFGKALGGAGGGFIAASEAVCNLLVQKSRPHIFSNSLPPVLCAIAMEAIDYLDKNPKIVSSLHKKIEYARKKVVEAGLKPLEGDSAIIPIIVGETARAIRISEEMLKRGIYAIGFGFPVVPEGEARIRLQISDALTFEDIDKAVVVIEECVKKF
ncbi:MAG: aminotransferase class I/II-fold pyridoxal phosphate-dependent enzyme [Turicibacter sp.]|nr:aminotransferase class I/II-fold pyridoxal phosphate-dependent enzyme [Turicibacter sp.]